MGTLLLVSYNLVMVLKVAKSYLKTMRTLQLCTEGKTQIVLWLKVIRNITKNCLLYTCLSVSTLKENSITKKSCHRSTNYDQHLNKMKEIQLVVEELKERHGESSFTNEQLTAWAHMLQIKKHDSYDTAPRNLF